MTTLVYIPGLLSDARVWRGIADTIGKRSIHANVTQDITIQAMAARILSATPGALIVLGHSMGGRVAMEIAFQAPERVTGLVLANTGHHPLKEGEPEKRQSKIDQGHADFAAMIKGWLPPMVAASRHNDSDLFSDLTDMAMSIGPKVHEQQIRALISRPNASDYLPNISCPILLLAGTEDVWSPVKQHQEIQNMVPDATLEVVENAGHFLPVEKPIETARLINKWLDQRKEDLNV